jgi:hypothetical protein
VLACIEPLENLRPAGCGSKAFAPPRHFYVLLANHGDIRVAFHGQITQPPPNVAFNFFQPMPKFAWITPILTKMPWLSF